MQYFFLNIILGLLEKISMLQMKNKNHNLRAKIIQI